MWIRFLFFFAGIFILSLGISVITHAGLGTGTVSCVALVLHELTHLSMGVFVFATNLFFFVLQTIVDPTKILNKAIRQIPVCMAFGAVFDFSMWLTSGIDPQSYAAQIGFVLLGMVLNGLGISGMVHARLLILPPEGFTLAVMHRWGGSFGTIRTGVDVLLVAMAALTSLICFGTILGLREGTVIAALGASRVANLFLHLWGKIAPHSRAID